MAATTFAFTGGSQTYVVPDRVTLIAFDLFGAQGGGGAGGLGGRSQGQLAVTPGETLTVIIGGMPSGTAGGFGGGGASGSSAYSGGGGATDIRRGTALADRLAVGGGGGGAPSDLVSGGAGGGLTGGLGGGMTAGTGGTQTEGGSSGGGLGAGGMGQSGGGGTAGGGGGGFYGGGGGFTNTASGLAGGGGGSSLVPSGGTTTSGARTGNGTATLTVVNNPPNAPTLTTMNAGQTVARLDVNRAAHSFSDPDPGDSQSAFQPQHRIVGAATWTTAAIAETPNQFYEFAAGSLALGDYERQVRTADSPGVWGPYSASGFFTVRDRPPGPTFLTPINGQTISSSQIFAEVSFSQGTHEYRALGDLAGAPDTANVIVPITNGGTVRTFTISGLANSQTIHLQDRNIVNGLAGPWTSISLLVSFVPPGTPSLSLATAVDGDGQPFGLVVAVTNPAPGTGEPSVTQHDVYVRCSATNPTADRYRPFRDDGTPVKRGVVPGGTWTDAATANGVDYSYRVVSHGSNGATSTSAWTSALPVPGAEFGTSSFGTAPFGGSA